MRAFQALKELLQWRGWLTFLHGPKPPIVALQVSKQKAVSPALGFCTFLLYDGFRAGTLRRPQAAHTLMHCDPCHLSREPSYCPLATKLKKNLGKNQKTQKNKDPGKRFPAWHLNISLGALVFLVVFVFPEVFLSFSCFCSFSRGFFVFLGFLEFL